MVMDIGKATDLVLEAKTRDKIAFALNVFRYPASNAVKLNITPYQRQMMIEQLEINDCSLHCGVSI